MRHVESQPVGLDHAARLLYVGAEYLTERGVHQVCCRVIALGGFAQVGVDLAANNVANFECGQYGAAMNAQPFEWRLHVIDPRDCVGPSRQRASITDLTARLSVERSAV